MEDQGFELEHCIELLERTPRMLRAWLSGLSEAWVMANEGPDTWSAFDVVGHLIHGEKTDWVPRVRHILEGPPDQPFVPFDRFAHLQDSEGKTMEGLLAEFEELRGKNLETLRAIPLDEGDMARQGAHPAFGHVTLGQLLATWVAHDLGHLGQIARVLAKRYTTAVGPWREYLSILNWK
jgi:hypothetical protein